MSQHTFVTIIPLLEKCRIKIVYTLLYQLQLFWKFILRILECKLLSHLGILHWKFGWKHASNQYLNNTLSITEQFFIYVDLSLRQPTCSKLRLHELQVALLLETIQANSSLFILITNFILKYIFLAILVIFKNYFWHFLKEYLTWFFVYSNLFLLQVIRHICSSNTFR